MTNTDPNSHVTNIDHILARRRRHPASVAPAVEPEVAPVTEAETPGAPRPSAGPELQPAAKSGRDVTTDTNRTPSAARPDHIELSDRRGRQGSGAHDLTATDNSRLLQRAKKYERKLRRQIEAAEHASGRTRPMAE